MDNVAELPTDLYANAFSSLQPRRAHNILIGRLKSARSFNEELADYFRDRCAVEDQYVKSLLKLSKKPNGIFNLGLQHSSTTPNEDEELSGGMSKIKELLQSELIDLMDAHSKLQTKVQVEVEAAFRNCKILSQSNWNQVRNLEDSLNATIKNYEDLELKLNKSKAKLNGTVNIKKIQNFQMRVSEEQKNFNQATQSYLDQAPMIYQSYQSFDKTRLVNLFESLTKFETLQADHSREKMDIFERSMMNLLSFDCQEEMQRFALRNGTLPPAVTGAPDSRSSSAAVPNTRTTPPPAGSQNSHGLSPATIPHPDRAIPSGDREQAAPSELPNPTIALSPSSVPLPPGPGTSLPQTASPSTYDPNHASIPKLSTPNIHVPIRSASPESASFAPPPRDLYVQRQTSIKSISRMYRSGSSNNSQRLHASPSSASINHTPKPSGSPSITEKLFSKSRFTQILSRSTGTGARMRSGTNPSQANRSTMYESGQLESNDGAKPLDTRTSSVVDSNPATDQANLYEVLGLDTEPDQETVSRSKRLSQLSNIPTRKVSRSAPPLPLQSSQPQTPPVPKQAEKPRLDAEGYTIPPEGRDRKPWENDSGTQVLDEDEGTRTTGGSRIGHENENENSERPNGNLAGLQQFAIKLSSSKPTDESESERQAAIQKVQNTLASVSLGTSSPGSLGPTRRSTTGLRGRRGDGRGVTMYDASTPPMPPGLHRAASVSRDSSGDNVPLSVVQAMKRQESREQLQEIAAEPSQSQVKTFPTPFALTPVGSSQSSPSCFIPPAPEMSQNQSSATQSGFCVQTADEEPSRDVRSNSDFSSMSNVTSAFGPGPSSGGTNPFLNSSFSPSICSPTFNFNPSGSVSGKRGESTSRRTYAAHGLTAVVRETLNVLMDGGSVKKVLVLGEVRLVWPSAGEQGQVRFKLSHHDRLEKVICQGAAVTSGSEPGEYILDVKAFKLAEEGSGSGSGQTVLKYRIYLDTKTAEEAAVRRFVPLQVVPRWRALRSRTELVLVYEPNPTFHQFDSEQALSPTEWKLEELGISARLYNSDGKSTNPDQVVKREIVDQQAVPAGLWDPEGKEMRWAVDAIGPSSGSQRIIGRFIHPEAAETDGGTEVESAEFTRANCGPVQVRWKMRGTCVSGIKLEIIGHDQLVEGSVVEKFEEVVKMVVAGTFLAR